MVPISHASGPAVGDTPTGMLSARFGAPIGPQNRRTGACTVRLADILTALIHPLARSKYAEVRGRRGVSVTRPIRIGSYLVVL
jgi:hypothetical protein